MEFRSFALAAPIPFEISLSLTGRIAVGTPFVANLPHYCLGSPNCVSLLTSSPPFKILRNHPSHLRADFIRQRDIIVPSFADGLLRRLTSVVSFHRYEGRVAVRRFAKR